MISAAGVRPVVRTVRYEVPPVAGQAPGRFTKIPGQPTVPGTRAIIRNGIAHAPEAAPEPVKRAIWATNHIAGKPYRWGGGHGSFKDTGYDCSGSVSYALGHAGLIASPTNSRGLMNWGRGGKGRWLTVYSRKGHSFAVIAGLRLDTTGRHQREGPRWHVQPRSTRGFIARHAPGL